MMEKNLVQIAVDLRKIKIVQKNVLKILKNGFQWKLKN